MTIRRLTLFKVAVPLKRVVRHASFERSVSENLVVRVTLADGLVGYGEGVPRPYVTGETVESTFAALEAHDWAQIVGRPANFAQVVERLESLTLPEIEVGPAGHGGQRRSVRLELAVLDAYGRRFGESVGRAVELAKVDGLERFAEAAVASGTAGRSRPSRPVPSVCPAVEDPDLRLPPGENQGRARRARMIRDGSSG